MIRIGNKIVAGSADVDLSTVLKSLNKTGLSIWIGTQTEHDALDDSIKNNEKTTFITYDTDEDIYLIIDTIISYGKTWSSVKISSELAKKINAADVYTKTQVDEIINAKLASALKYRGAVNTTALLPASAENGDTYFVKADGFMYAYNATEADWDALGTVADMTNYFTKAEITAMLQDKADKFQYDVLPAPSSETVGVLLQYTGADTQDYKNGYFYKGIDNGDSTYDWELAKTGDYYSKSEVDNLLENKADVAALESKADVADVEAIQAVIPSDTTTSYKLVNRRGATNNISPINPWISDNFNNARADSAGIYEFTVLNSATNTPKLGSNYTVIYVGFSETLGQQIAQQNDTNNIYQRSRSGDTWYSWRQIGFNDQIYKNEFQTWNGSGNKYIKVSGLYTRVGLDTATYLVVSRNGEAYILICGCTDGGALTAPIVRQIYGGTQKLSTNGFYWDSSTGDIAIMTQGYNEVRITQIEGIRTDFTMSAIQDSNPLSNPTAVVMKQLSIIQEKTLTVNLTDVPVHTLQAGTTGTSFNIAHGIDTSVYEICGITYSCTAKNSASGLWCNIYAEDSSGKIYGTVFNIYSIQNVTVTIHIFYQ